MYWACVLRKQEDGRRSFSGRNGCDVGLLAEATEAVMFACLHLARRHLHFKCLRLAAVRDPAYLGLFEPQERQGPLSEEQRSATDDELAKRNDLRIAFCYKIRDWARTTPHEYISRPPSRPKSRRIKQSATQHRKSVAEEEVYKHIDDDDDADDEDEDTEGDAFEEADDGEVDIVDDEDELNALDNEDVDFVDKEDCPATRDSKFVDGFQAEHHEDGKREVDTGETRDTTTDERAPKNVLSFDPPDGHDHLDEELYYFTQKGKLKFKPIHIIAPKDEIYQRLSQSGLVSSKLKRPLPVSKLVKKSDAEIVGWYYYCSIELLQFFRICHNLKEIKAIVEYHIRWSAIRTLAKKYKCNPREIVKKYGRDLECEDKKGKKVRLMTRLEIKDVARGVNKRVEMIHRFRALNILDEMD